MKNIIKSSARLAGYDKWVVDDFSAHSLRVGAAQELLRQGNDSIAIMRAGGWRTHAVLARYLEKAEHNIWDSAWGNFVAQKKTLIAFDIFVNLVE